MSTTESSSHYNNLEGMTVSDLLQNINKEDQTVAIEISKALPQIEALTDQVISKLAAGGRLFILVQEPVDD